MFDVATQYNLIPEAIRILTFVNLKPQKAGQTSAKVCNTERRLSQEAFFTVYCVRNEMWVDIFLSCNDGLSSPRHKRHSSHNSLFTLNRCLDNKYTCSIPYKLYRLGDNVERVRMFNNKQILPEN